MADEYHKVPIFDKKIQRKEKGNFKKTMCRNIILHGNCIQGDHCNFAHSFDEQIIDTERKIVYDIIDSTTDLSYINLSLDKQLYDTLKNLTSFCDRCIANQCSGGYNCRHGASNIKYQICNRDLHYGFCNDQTCNLVHLTKRGMQPFFKKNEFKKNETFENEDEFFGKNDDKLVGKLLQINDFSDDDESDTVSSLSLDDNDNEIVEDSNIDQYSISIFIA